MVTSQAPRTADQLEDGPLILGVSEAQATASKTTGDSVTGEEGFEVLLARKPGATITGR